MNSIAMTLGCFIQDAGTQKSSKMRLVNTIIVEIKGEILNAIFIC